MKQDPEWKRCRLGCCRTGVQICHRSYRCVCHAEPPLQSAPAYDEYEDDWSAW